MRKEKGVTITGLIIVLILLALLAVLALKVVPVLLEFQTIERQMQSIADDQTLRGASRAQVDRAWAMRAAVETNIKNFAGPIDMERQGDKIVVSGEYSVKVPLFWNVSLWFDFKPHSK